MGGSGSGRRWRYGARSTADELRGLDVRSLARAGVLTPGSVGGWQWSQGGSKVASIATSSTHDYLTVTYRQRSDGENWVTQNYPIRLARTPCNFGGSRVWFLCPAVRCNRRVAILYGGGVFACRHCYDLAYASSRESPSDRACRRAGKVRAKLGWPPGILNDIGGKPKWMRWSTFERLVTEHDHYADMSVARMMQSIMHRIRIDDA